MKIRKAEIPLLFLFFIFFQNSYSQTGKIYGIIVEEESLKPIPFVNIVYNETQQGVISGIDGRFVIDNSEKAAFITCSAVGYHPLTLPLEKIFVSRELLIPLRKKIYSLDEIHITPGKNPAHRIIQLANINREKNHPEKNSSFSYISYNKFTFDLDKKFMLRQDSILKEKKKTSPRKKKIAVTEKDTAPEKTPRYKNLGELIESQHLFLMESISKRIYQYPGKNDEQIITSRVSGFNDATFTLLATQMQSFSFYDDLISIFGYNYLNPISLNSHKRYFFLLEDTLYNEKNDSIFVISFQPKKNTNFKGLKGVLHINSHGWAIQTVTAEPAEQGNNLSMKIQQKYERINEKYWFPVQLNTEIILANLAPPEGKKIKMTGSGKSFLTQITINGHSGDQKFDNIVLKVSSDTVLQNNSMLQTYRYTPLTPKDSLTYHVIDSLGEKKKFDKLFKTAESLSLGYIPVKYFNISLSQLLRYNRYEGIRTGMGLITNEKLIPWFRLGGHIAYGFRDKKVKYGGISKVIFSRRFQFHVLYNDDVKEMGGTQFIYAPQFLTPESYREFYVKDMVKYTEKEASLNFHPFRNIETRWYLNHSAYHTLTPYGFNAPETLNETYPFTEVGLKLRIAPGEKFMETPSGHTLSLGTKYPVLMANVRKGMKYMNGKFDYLKIEARITQQIHHKTLGETNIQLEGGFINRALPYFYSFAGKGSYDDRFSLDASESFNTMRMGEFYSDRFLNVFIRHNFGPVLFKKGKFRPDLIFSQHVGMGAMKKTAIHQGITYQTLEKGYFESGLLINNLLKVTLNGFGMGVYYRYGPYSLNEQIENFAFKFTLTSSL